MRDALAARAHMRVSTTPRAIGINETRSKTVHAFVSPLAKSSVSRHRGNVNNDDVTCIHVGLNQASYMYLLHHAA